MASIIDQMTEIYCFVDDFFKAHTGLAQWRSSPNSDPAFTDSEVITIALMQSCLGVDSLKQTYNLIASNFASAFPLLCSYQQWIARLHKLSPIVGRLFESARRMGECKLYLIDSKPIPVCKAIRHGRVRLLREEGAYFGKSSAGWFFGFKLHILRNKGGCIIDAILTSGNATAIPVFLCFRDSSGNEGITVLMAAFRKFDSLTLNVDCENALMANPVTRKGKKAYIHI